MNKRKSIVLFSLLSIIFAYIGCDNSYALENNKVKPNTNVFTDCAPDPASPNPCISIDADNHHLNHVITFYASEGGEPTSTDIINCYITGLPTYAGNSFIGSYYNDRYDEGIDFTINKDITPGGTVSCSWFYSNNSYIASTTTVPIN